MRFLRLLLPLLVTAALFSCALSSNVLAYDDPYVYQPLYGSPDSSGLSHSPSRDLYGRETWDAPPRQQSPYNNYSSGQPHRSEPWSPPSSNTRDYNVIGRDGRAQLCTGTKDTVYCC